ncbi:MAG TPA: TIR domain-containing protein [Nitrospira sp.]|nr:TIR domain-containing protein [Nitrospira sp.]
MAKVYLSYYVTDRSLVRDLSAQLRNLGHQMTVEPEGRPQGEDSWAFVREACENSDCVLVFISRESQDHYSMLSEVAIAQTLRKPLIPIVIRGARPPRAIANLARIDHNGEARNDVAYRVDQAIRRIPLRNVFIVHGHHGESRGELSSLLTSLDLCPLILQEQDGLGMTIIEKFEHYASAASFAFILMTRDDALGSGSESRWRARQNVILELGWFMAKLGRPKVAILSQGELEIPSDILGVECYRFEKSVLEVENRIRQSLRTVGLTG